MSWTLLDLAPEVTAEVALPDTVPVREASLAAILRGDRVDLGALVDELHHAVTEAPELAPVLGPGIARTAFHAAGNDLAAHDYTAAAARAGTGLAYKADDVSLRMLLSHALHGQGRHDAAIAHGDVAVGALRATGTVAPAFWLTHARALDEAERPAEALPLLEEIEPVWRHRDDFPRLLARVRARAAGPTPPAVQGQLPAAAPAKRSRVPALLVLLFLLSAAAAYVIFSTDVLDSDDGTAAVVPTSSVAVSTTAPSTSTTVAPTTTTTTTVAPTTTIALIALPDVVGTNEEEALNALAAVGLVAEVVYTESYAAPSGQVTATEPAAAAEAEPGQAVVVHVAIRPTECNDPPDVIPPTPFGDVAELPEASRRAIDWAAAVGLVSTADAFNPTQPMTRAGAVTVLWRYFCEPAPAGTPTAFDDVDPSAFYADPVAWATTADVMGGTSATTMSPNDPITRGAFITILWRAMGEPAPAAAAPFDDVPEGAFYATPIAWAFGEGLVSGTSPTTFAPDAPLDRITTIILFDRVEQGINPLVGG